MTVNIKKEGLAMSKIITVAFDDSDHMSVYGTGSLVPSDKGWG